MCWLYFSINSSTPTGDCSLHFPNCFPVKSRLSSPFLITKQNHSFLSKTSFHHYEMYSVKCYPLSKTFYYICAQIILYTRVYTCTSCTYTALSKLHPPLHTFFTMEGHKDLNKKLSAKCKHTVDLKKMLQIVEDGFNSQEIIQLLTMTLFHPKMNQ